jgi:hypothetical protein
MITSKPTRMKEHPTKNLSDIWTPKNALSKIAVKTNARTTNGYALDKGTNVKIHAQSGTRKLQTMIAAQNC